MSFAEVLHQLPTLTVAERQLLIRRALELDEPGLSADEEALVEERLSDHRRNGMNCANRDWEPCS